MTSGLRSQENRRPERRRVPRHEALLAPLFVLGSLLSLSGAPGAASAAPLSISRFDTAGEWSRGQIVADPIKEGTGSLQWNNGTDTSVSKTVSLDLSAYNTLRFWLHANHPLVGSNILVYLGSENAATDGGDYYSYQLAVDWTGWKEVVLPFDLFSRNRTPLGWGSIDRVAFNASGWNNTPDPTLVLHLDDLRADSVVMVGPVTTDEELFAALNLEHAGLEQVRAAVQANDLATAKTKLCEYMRARVSPPWFFDPHVIDDKISFDATAANKVVAGTFTQVGYTHTFPNGVVDWGLNPTENNPNVPYSAEWQWQQGRMQFWPNLGRAFWRTGDVTYADTFVSHVETFVTQRPVPTVVNNMAKSSWRTIEAGIRMSFYWPEAWFRFLHAPAFDDAHMILMLKSFLEHGRYLHAFKTSGNWVFHELGGLYTVGAVFPEFKEAADWRSLAVAGMERERAAQFLPDGAQYELTPGYHEISLDYMVDVVRMARLVGRDEEIPEDYVDGMRNGFHWLIKLSTPAQGEPYLNDSWVLDLPSRLANAKELFPHDPLITRAANGRTGTWLPSFESIALTSSGYTVFRTGWAATDHYALLDVGPLGFGHDHQDKLNVLVFPFGRQLLWDNGGGPYEDSPYRVYGVGTYSHNTVIVDGDAQARPIRSERDSDILGAGNPETPAPLFHTEGRFDYAAGYYWDGYHVLDNRIAKHRRELVFVKPDFFVVIDQLLPSDAASHTYQARWHLLTTAFAQDDAVSGVSTTDEGKPNLAIVPLARNGLSLRTGSGVTEPELLGWDLNHTAGYSPALTVLHDRSGTGVQRFVTLLLPLAVGASEHVASVTESHPSYRAVLDDGSSIEVILPADEGLGARIVITPANGPDETVVIDPDAFGCTDADKDGHYAAAATCSQVPSDCNDAEPAIHPGAAEACNGRDDDCDEAVDEGCPCVVGTTQACYGGDEATRNVGACREGSQRCSAEGWPACAGAVLPVEEVASDGVDNDCDGTVDESSECSVGEARACYGGDEATRNVGACREGAQSCSVEGWSSCAGAILPVEEVANDGVDNDCDGAVDEGSACELGTSRPCYGGDEATRNVGACREGVQSCSVEGWSSCAGAVLPVDEIADDGVDNDCDGSVDEGSGPVAGTDGGSADASTGETVVTAGCGCQTSGGAGAVPLSLVGAFGLLSLRRRVRR